MLNEIKQILASKGITVLDEEIQDKIDEIDKEALITQERSKFTVELWDRQSPINGVDADTILRNRNDIPENGAVYLIRENGVVKTFQPHDPTKQGYEPMTNETALHLANDEVDKLVEGVVRDKIVQQVVDMFVAQ